MDNAESENLTAKENSVGCQQKCAFCFYSHWNGYIRKKQKSDLASEHYVSGPGIREDFFQSLDWERCKGGGITALDGITEETRLRVNKKIKYSDIIETLLRSNKVQYDKNLSVKVYCIAGFPWEVPGEIENLDLLRAIKELKNDLKNKIVIRMHFSHFIPFQKTPLWAAPFNFNNYRKYCIEHNLMLDYERVKVYSGGAYTGSPKLAAQSTIIQRAFNEDEKYLKVLANPKFQKLNFFQAKRFLKQDFKKFLIEQESETIGNIKTKYKYKN